MSSAQPYEQVSHLKGTKRPEPTLQNSIHDALVTIYSLRQALHIFNGLYIVTQFASACASIPSRAGKSLCFIMSRTSSGVTFCNADSSDRMSSRGTLDSGGGVNVCGGKALIDRVVWKIGVNGSPQLFGRVGVPDTGRPR
jgi:hypothetical protein